MATTTRILDANVNGTVYTANANDALEALDTCHSGTTAPTDEVANGKFWLDTSTTPSVLKVYDNAGWNVVYSGRGDLTVAGTVNATALTGNGSGITGVATAAQGTLADSAVQPNDSPTFGVVTATSYAGDGSALTGIPLPPSQTTAVWEAGTDTTESVVSAAKVAAAIGALAGTELFGTLNATGVASQAISGLDLTDFKAIKIIVSGLKQGSGFSNRDLYLNGTTIIFDVVRSGVCSAIVHLNVADGVGLSFVHEGGVGASFDTNLTTASTSITFTFENGDNFTAGSLYVYGER